MKAKSALRESISSVKFLLVFTPIAWFLFAATRWWGAAWIAGMLSLGLVGDVLNILYIKRRIRQDPGYAERRD